MNVPETARKTLEILSRDGWCKWQLTAADYSLYPENVVPMPPELRDSVPGSHCLGGAWNLAVHGADSWAGEEFLVPLADAIRLKYPEFTSGDDHDSPDWYIADWNNAPETTETQVRELLEEMAA